MFPRRPRLDYIEVKDSEVFNKIENFDYTEFLFKAKMRISTLFSN